MKLNKAKQKRDPRGGKSMGQLWDALTPQERNLCVIVLREFGGRDIHLGALPLMGVSTITQALHTARKNTSENRRAYTALLQKLNGTTVDGSKQERFVMNLRHKKVVARFGDYAERGTRIPFTQRFLTTAGLKAQAFTGHLVPNREAKVWPMFTMNFVKRVDKDWSSYNVTCPKLHGHVLRQWLNAYCR